MTKILENREDTSRNSPWWKKVIAWGGKNWFYITLFLLATIGVPCAFFIPPYIPGLTNDGNTVVSVRQGILAVLAGALTMLTLSETHRKNTHEKDKNDRDHTRQVHAERRSRYTAAVEQLANEKAAVRLGGIYTLVGLADEWLADDSLTKDKQNEEGQVIINNLCSYIRSPFPLAEKIDEYKAYKKLEELNKKESENLLNRVEQLELKALVERLPNAQDYKTPKKITADYATFHEEQDVRRTIFVEMERRSSVISNNEEGDVTVTPGAWSDFDFDFSRAPIFYPLNGLTIEKGNFSGAKFYADTDFFKATFNNDASFFKATFNSAAYFGKATFNSTAYFGEATFNSTAYFGTATFNYFAGFGEANFHSTAYFGEANFHSTAYFGEGTFHSAAYFGEANFHSTAHFGEATFNHLAGFGEANFHSTAYFGEATFNQMANFRKATFNSTAYFGEATFNSTAYFGETSFTQMADFREATFTQVANFRKATFNSTAYFGEATFNSTAYFGRANFTQVANFGRANFTQVANFRKATFNSTAYFDEATFNSTAYFGKATFTQMADFLGTTFIKSVNFSNTTFKNYAPFFVRRNLRAWFSVRSAQENYRFKVSETHRPIRTEQITVADGRVFTIPVGCELFDPEPLPAPKPEEPTK